MVNAMFGTHLQEPCNRIGVFMRNNSEREKDRMTTTVFGGHHHPRPVMLRTLAMETIHNKDRERHNSMEFCYWESNENSTKLVTLIALQSDSRTGVE